MEGKHRDFRDIKPIKINNQIGKIERGLTDTIKLIMDDEVYDNDFDIYEKLCTLTGINAIRDDFVYWQKNDYECYAAKPLWINLTDQNNHHIIFDDNIRLEAIDDCIVNLRLIDDTNTVFENVDFNDYPMFDTCCMVQPNLLELLNPHLKLDSKRNHYLDRIKRSEKNYHQILEDKKTICIHKKPIEEEQEDRKDIQMHLPLQPIPNTNNCLVPNGLAVSKRGKSKSMVILKKRVKECLEIEHQKHENDENKINTTLCTIQ